MMDWIKIDHENLRLLDFSVKIILEYVDGLTDTGFFHDELNNGEHIYFRKDNECCISGCSNYIRWNRYAIIEEPKPMKYNSIDEFFKKSGWKIVDENILHKNDQYFHQIYLCSIGKVCGSYGEGISTRVDFMAKSKEELNLKLLKWANDELN